MKSYNMLSNNKDTGPAPHGAGGLKFFADGYEGTYSYSPAPHGAGGLKSLMLGIALVIVGSRPARGGWIEILFSLSDDEQARVPPRTGRVD